MRFKKALPLHVDDPPKSVRHKTGYVGLALYHLSKFSSKGWPVSYLHCASLGYMSHPIRDLL